jgi:hypothetical protein
MGKLLKEANEISGSFWCSSGGEVSIFHSGLEGLALEEGERGEVWEMDKHIFVLC